MAYINPYFSGLTSGLSAAQAGGNPQSQFQMSGGGIMGGAASGAASGFAAGGPIGGAIGGLVGGVGSFFKQDAQLKQATEDVNTSFNGTVDIYGRPQYNSQEFGQGIQDLQGLTEATRPGAHALRPRRRRQMERKVGELYRGIQQGQQDFNRADTSFRDRSIQFQEYLERANDQPRLNNLYR